MSIEHWLSKCKQQAVVSVADSEDELVEQDAALELPHPFSNVRAYMNFLKTSIDSRRLSMAGQTVIGPMNSFVIGEALSKWKIGTGSAEVIAHKLRALSALPNVFVWAPDLLVPGLKVPCPTCKNIVSSTQWTPERPLHTLGRRAVYVTKKYICYNCEAAHHPSALVSALLETKTPKVRRQKTFQADNPDVMAAFPVTVRALWPLATNGRILCHSSVVDFVRALATQTSWAGIAEALNEIEEKAQLAEGMLSLSLPCTSSNIHSSTPSKQHAAGNCLSADWVRNIYLMDWERRQNAVSGELASEVGDDVLAMDWTLDAAARCNASYLFNVMDGKQHILFSALMDSCSPHDAAPHLMHLLRRGVRPKIVYVDCECCGLWKTIVRDIWPEATVKLDGMHAIRRLTQTVTSTQHPWHRLFCKELSAVVYTYDQAVLSKLSAARRREGLSQLLPNHVKNKFVPRRIMEADDIAAAIERVVREFAGTHPIAGAYHTPATEDALRNLLPHVKRGCLCDPPNVALTTPGKWVSIGGERFQSIQTKRGASALEGFHAHQKRWLGCLACHATEAGSALLADGAWCWNRKRRRDAEH